MRKRECLKGSIVLRGESDGKSFYRTFRIAEKISGDGASTLCYKAWHGNSGKGVLKEFYPQNAYDMYRNQEGQLLCKSEFEDAKLRFERELQMYLEPYHKLLEAKQRSSLGEELATFIPPFEIYYGGDTVYIWSPQTKLETFDKLCEEIHKNPTVEPEYKLVQILDVIENLTKCVRDLHIADMIHRDIKPSNFGFVKRKGETLPQTLSMFDVNTVCSVYDPPMESVGSEGYREPEAGYKAPNNRTDIYSIGAVLFTALINTDEVSKAGYLYQDSWYESLGKMVDGSKLMRAARGDIHPRLGYMFKIILQKCLGPREKRYQNCEDLLSDIDTALNYALPTAIAKKRRSGEKWVLADVKKSFDRAQENSAMLAIQYHLYQHPLYQGVAAEDPNLNILVLGFGKYGQKYLDASLQAGQIWGKNLSALVVSDDASDLEIYLEQRPELSNFFSINDENVKENYGRIKYERKNLFSEEIRSVVGGVHHIFIALGEDKINYSMAKACREAVNAAGEQCSIHFIWEGKPLGKGRIKGIVPVYLGADIHQSELYPEIERMAFNTHLVWNKRLHIAQKSLKKEFLKKYHHASCVSNVLSIKYKLYSVGIDIDKMPFMEAASVFESLIQKDKSIKYQLICMEHRRWVTEKLCQGWRRVENLEECADGATKDEIQKKHICLVKSRPDRKLAGYEKKNWDEFSDDKLNEFDELDRMSVMLHRVYVEQAKEKKQLNENSIGEIRALIDGNKKAVAAFREWTACARDIWNGDKKKINLYGGLKEVFIKAVEELSEQVYESVLNHMGVLEKILYPILLANEYRDYKQDDVALIENIPFILTYSENICMAVPFAMGDNTKIFGNVAAATVVDPDKIFFLCLAEEKQELGQMADAFSGMLRYLDKKKRKAVIELAIFCKSMSKVEIEAFRNPRVKQIKIVTFDTTEQLSKNLQTYLKQKARGKNDFIVEKNDTKFSGMLQGIGIYESFNSYSFDSRQMRFSSVKNCEYLNYIIRGMHLYLTVSDMAAFRQSEKNNFDQPEFYEDYRELWRKYQEDTKTWKYLCSILGKVSRERDKLAIIRPRRAETKKQEVQTYTYILPSVCKITVERILKFLKKYGLIEEDSILKGYTSDSCKVEIRDRNGNQSEFDRLFSDICPLLWFDAVGLQYNTDGSVRVSFDKLTVENVDLSNKKDKNDKKVKVYGKPIQLLKYFEDKGYLIHLQVEEDGKTSFAYATRQIKQLLTNAGRILEIYTYHKVRETGKFDDVVSSFEICWEDTEVKNEFDCIVTKGFQMLFIECKAREQIEQDFYFKLAQLAERFGINAKAVLIADTQEQKSKANQEVNRMQRQRGDKLGVVTIWQSKEINDIGNILAKIMDGSYKQEEKIGGIYV